MEKNTRILFLKAGILILGNNLSKECISKVIPDFYRTCLQDWSEMFNEIPCDSLSVLAQPLWNNTYIRVNNIPYFCRLLFEENVNYIRDIIENEGNFIPFKKLNVKQSLLFRWLELKHSIMKEWISIVKMNPLPIIFEHYPPFSIKNRNYSIKNMTVKEIYKSLVYKRKENPKGQETLNRMVGVDIDWSWAYSVIYKSTIKTSLREFQYKILNNILAVNALLFKWGIMDSGRCSYCFLNQETLDHLFCYCDTSVTFYLQIKNWFYGNGLELPEFKVETILVGHKSDSSQIMLINEIIFIYKHSRNKLNNLNVTYFIYILGQIGEIEKQIAMKNGKYVIHLKKWEILFNALKIDLEKVICCLVFM